MWLAEASHLHDLHELVKVVNDDSETGPSGCDALENRRYFSGIDDCKNTKVDVKLIKIGPGIPVLAPSRSSRSLKAFHY